jgi:hypothetical protein
MRLTREGGIGAFRMDSQSDPPKFEQLSGTKRMRQSPPQIEEDDKQPSPRTIAHDLQALCTERRFAIRGPHESCSILFDCTPGSDDVGCVRLLRILRGSEMSVHATARRIRGDRPAVFRMQSTLLGVDVDFVATAQVVVARIFLGGVELGYSFCAESAWRAAMCHWARRLCESSSGSITSRRPQAGCTPRPKQATSPP